jgi:[ribosomal protein S5]-alanine N-acetyltransferase
MNNIPILTTKRLTLRDIKLDDANDIYYYASNYDVSKFMVWNRHKSIEDTFNFINLTIENYTNESYFDWAIVLKENNKVIGTCGFPNYRNKIHYTDIGYVISKDYWNRGITTEAVNKIIEFAFKELNVIRIQAMCQIENLSSENLMKKIGMSCEGILKKYLLKNDKYYDMKLYAILKEEFKY